MTYLLCVEWDDKASSLIHCLGSSGNGQSGFLAASAFHLFDCVGLVVVFVSVLCVFLLVQVKWYSGKPFPAYFQHFTGTI